jgi:pimeloyl-ACP methyl ester carboxylesterase
MGGAIAQEFVHQFPVRVSRLILCATMCGGTRATYAKPEITRVMRDLDGLTPVTYSPGYLAQHEALAEDQMRRETALPTPLHAAATHKPKMDGVRLHFVSSGWSILHGMIELRRVLRGIELELIDSSSDRSLLSRTALTVEKDADEMSDGLLASSPQCNECC